MFSHAKLSLFLTALGISLIATSCGSKTPETGKNEETKTSATAKAAAACAFPTGIVNNSNEQTAWQIFVAANCPVNGHPAWEGWTEQTCLFAPQQCAPQANAVAGAPVHHLHGSFLAIKTRLPNLAATAIPSGDCNPMNTSGPFAPKNLAASPQFCEEVYPNADEVSFIQQPAPQATLTTYPGQVAYATAHSNAITAPTPSIEIKVDWLPAASLKSDSTFNCTTPPDGLYVENISGTCYALVGIHVSSKLLPNWLWATFEPQSTMTNPNRCKPDLYNSCNDPYGSNPATSTGADTAVTQPLSDLMTQAGLSKAFLNYRLVAAQTAYLDSNQQPTQLGNSFVEFNAGVKPHQASCITCHAYATIRPAAKENSCCTFTAMIGTPNAAQQQAISQDFSWMIGFGPSLAATSSKAKTTH
jgi:hypothetical protein